MVTTAERNYQMAVEKAGRMMGQTNDKGQQAAAQKEVDAASVALSAEREAAAAAAKKAAAPAGGGGIWDYLMQGSK